MSFDKVWSNYVLHHLDAQKLDQMIIDLDCKILGCRSNNKKSLKSIHQSLKIGALSKRVCIGKEVMEQVEKFYKPLLEKEEVQFYLKMSPTEFLAQIDTFKEQENKEVQIAVVNSFLQTSTMLSTEKDEMVKYFSLTKKKNKVDLVAQKETKEQIEKTKEEIKESEVEALGESIEENQISRKETKRLKILEHLYQEAKEKEKQQELKIKALTQDLHNANKASEEQEKTYQKELRELKGNLEQLSQDYEQLKTEKETIEDKLKQTKLGIPYVFIGSEFIKKKVEHIKSKHASEVPIIYLSTKQWCSGLGKAKHEVAEVYAFFYDMEWLMREMLYKEYQEKLKIFPSDDIFYDYIEQHWEA